MPSPVQAAQNDKLVSLLAGPGGGAPGGGAPAGGGAPPSATTQALQSASQQLDGANPQGLLQVAQQMAGDLAQVYLMCSQRMPDGCKDIASARDALGRFIKTAQKAAQTQIAAAPIVNQAGIGPSMTAQQGQPDISSLLGM
jgi:hypothetical protein